MTVECAIYSVTFNPRRSKAKFCQFCSNTKGQKAFRNLLNPVTRPDMISYFQRKVQTSKESSTIIKALRGSMKFAGVCVVKKFAETDMLKTIREMNDAFTQRAGVAQISGGITQSKYTLRQAKPRTTETSLLESYELLQKRPDKKKFLLYSKDNDSIVTEEAEPEFPNVDEAFCDVAPTIRTLVKECECMISQALSIEMESYYSVSILDTFDQATTRQHTHSDSMSRKDVHCLVVLSESCTPTEFEYPYIEKQYANVDDISYGPIDSKKMHRIRHNFGSFAFGCQRLDQVLMPVSESALQCRDVIFFMATRSTEALVQEEVNGEVFYLCLLNQKESRM